MDSQGLGHEGEPAEIVHFDGSKTTVSEFVVTIRLDQPMRVLVSLVLPLILLVCLTFSVFWARPSRRHLHLARTAARHRLCLTSALRMVPKG